MSTGPNYMQRVFDLLRASPDLLTIEELAARLHVDCDAVRNALRRLTRLQALTTVCQDRQWRYGVKPSAHRPHETRGRWPRIIRPKETA